MSDQHDKQGKNLFEGKTWWQKALFFCAIGFVFTYILFREYDWIIVAAIFAGIGIWTWPAWKPLLFVLVGLYAAIAVVAIALAIIGGIVVYSGWSIKRSKILEIEK